MGASSKLLRLAVLGLSLLAASGLRAESTLLLASGVRPPHSTPDQTGFIDRLVREAFHRLGRKVDIVQLPAQRALVEANRGEVDGDLMRVYEIPHNFPNLRIVPEPLIDFDFVVFTRHLDFTPDGWDSLRPYEVGIISGWKILEHELKDTRSLTSVGDSHQLMRLLANDRVDLVVSERWQGLQAIHDLGLHDIRLLEPPTKTRTMFLMLNKRHQDMTSDLAATFRIIKQDGTYQRLFDETLGELIQTAP